ncbi:hypothetical protein ACFVR6_03645 [Microbacterium sp. NPDC058021]|uniref:hypothetical protein n=1 Tax=Microbacterium sp. NPDC058021 TaxID=3346306 RepID=UPI0036DC6B54
MAGDVVDHAGGIYGLLDLVDEHQEAVEYELLRAGHRLRDVPSKQLNWRDLYVLLRRWQKTPHNAVGEAIHGHALWSIEEQLLAVAVDTLAFANWQRMRKPHAPKPKRLPRPWEASKGRQLGSEPIPISQFDDWWESKAR